MNVVDAQDKRDPCMSRRFWPLLGLVVGLMLLAHDVAMAGGAHSAAASDAHAVHLASHPAETAALIAHQAASHSVNTAHPNDCDTTRGAVSTPTGGRVDPGHSDGVAAVSLTHGSVLRTRVWHGVEHPPPPAVRRALLQVYRI